MDYFEEKVEAFIKENYLEQQGLRSELVTLLKEQDRDTRHACAEAVNSLAMDHDTVVQAHAACMNAKPKG